MRNTTPKAKALVKALHKLADKEPKSRFGSYEDRLKNFANFKKNI